LRVYIQIQDIEREHVPLPGGDAGGQDIRPSHRHGSRMLDAVRGAQAVRVAAAVWRRNPVAGPAGCTAVAVRARRHHTHTVRASKPAGAPRTLPHILPAEAVQQLLRQRPERDRRVVRGRGARQVGGHRRRCQSRRPETRFRPVVRQRVGRHRVRQVDHAAVCRPIIRSCAHRRSLAHRHRDDAQLVLQQW